MDFVEAGVASGDEPGGESGGPIPAAAVAAQATKQEEKENKIFREVGKFTDDVVDKFNLMPGE